MSDAVDHDDAGTNADVRKVLRSGGRRGRLPALIATATALVLVALLVWWLWPGEEPLAWDTRVVERGDIVLSATATGNLEPQRKVIVGAEISGLIREVRVSENDTVAVGDVLALFEPEELEVALEQAEARLAVARAAVVETEATLEETAVDERRAADLAERNLASRAQLDAAMAARKRAAARLDHARATVREAQGHVSAARTRLSKTVISSPIDGVVLTRNVEPGNTVAATLQAPELFLLAEDLDHMELHVALDEADVGQVRSGQPATFTVDAWPGEEFQAEVVRVHLYPVIEAGVVTYTTVLGVDNPEGMLLPGMTATATISTGTRTQVLRVPNLALRFVPPVEEARRDGLLVTRPGTLRRDAAVTPGNTVWVLRDGALVEVRVAPGATDGRFTEIVEGDLDVGDRVIVGMQRTGS
jgi:HlyD family secretion protein